MENIIQAIWLKSYAQTISLITLANDKKTVKLKLKRRRYAITSQVD
ncbi:hypothetical protein SAMN05660816_06836 [Niastella yeongjuensis]|nr:hypothetical protein SAMN05660816_06836 [Niastella yeongjuensis]